MGGGNSDAMNGAAQGASAGSAAGPWGAAIGGVAGLIGGMESSDEANSAKRQQQWALEDDQAKRDAFISQQNALYAPILQQQKEEAANPQPLNYGMNLGNINQQTLAATQRMGGQMAAHGMTGSGVQAAGLQGLESGRVGQLSEAFNTGLNARRQLGMNLLQRYNPLGNAEFGQAALPQQMQFGAREQGIANTGMQQGFGAVGKGLGGFLDSQMKPGAPGQVPGQQQFNGANPTTMSGTETLGMGGGVPQMQGQSPQMPGEWNSPNIGGTFQPDVMPSDWSMYNSGGQTPTMPTPDTGGGLNLAAVANNSDITGGF